jgi:hypothetical protein
MKMFDSIQSKYSHLFQFTTLLTIFLHRRRMDLRYEVINNHLLILLTMDELETISYMFRIILSFVSKIGPNFNDTFKLKILTLFCIHGLCPSL